MNIFACVTAASVLVPCSRYEGEPKMTWRDLTKRRGKSPVLSRCEMPSVGRHVNETYLPSALMTSFVWSGKLTL